MSWDQLPMVSHVIALPIFDRVAALTFTFYALTVRLANIRCYFKMLDGIANPCKNDLMLVFGIISCITCVMIPLFDCSEWGPIHNPCAVIFFGSATFEAFMYTYEMSKHKEKFPVEDHATIDRLGPLAWITLASAVTMAVTLNLWGVHYWAGPFFEWTTTGLLLNYYVVIQLTNPYLSSIT